MVPNPTFYGDYIMTEVQTEATVVETEAQTEVTVEAVVESPVAPRNTYKKTDRVRKAKLHEKLEAQLRTTERALVNLGANAEVTLERNNDPTAARYARAIFDVTFVAGDKRIPIRGKTAEEVLAIARGVRLVADLLK